MELYCETLVLAVWNIVPINENFSVCYAGLRFLVAGRTLFQLFGTPLPAYVWKFIFRSMELVLLLMWNFSYCCGKLLFLLIWNFTSCCVELLTVDPPPRMGSFIWRNLSQYSQILWARDPWSSLSSLVFHPNNSSSFFQGWNSQSSVSGLNESCFSGRIRRGPE